MGTADGSITTSGAGRDSSISSKEDKREKKPNQRGKKSIPHSEATCHSEKLETATSVDSEHGDREVEPECPPETPKDIKSDGCEQDIMGTADGSITTSGTGRDSSRSSKEDKREKKPNQRGKKPIPDSEATCHSEKLETATGVDSAGGYGSSSMLLPFAMWHLQACSNVIPLDSYDTGLRNVGENSCFLNVIIQSLRHIKRFRNEFLKLPVENYRHIDDLALFHLHQILTALSNASMNNKTEVVASTPLRSALKDKFQEYEEQDAHEALEEILARVHRSFTNGKGSPSTESACNNGACISHSLFGMNLEKIIECGSCGAKSTCETNTSFYLLVLVDSVRTAKESHRASSFSKLLHSVDKESLVGGDSCVCGGKNKLYYTLAPLPHVFTIVLNWKKIQESIEDISDMFKTLITEIDLGVIYPYLKTNIPYRLVSMVIETWDDVVVECKRGPQIFRPQILFYETAT